MSDDEIASVATFVRQLGNNFSAWRCRGGHGRQGSR